MDNIKRTNKLTCLVSVFFILITISINVYAFGKKSDICGSWNNYCQGGQNVRSYSPTPTGPTAKELREQWEAQDLKDASWDAYDTGVEYFEKGEWGNAVIHFQEALEFNPENYDAVDDLRTAKDKLRQAYEMQRKNKALQEAAAAAKHSKTLNYTESQKVFDTAGSRTTVSNNVRAVDARGYKQTLGKKVVIPKEYQNNPKIQKMQKERKSYEQEFKKLEKSLNVIKKKRVNAKEDKGKLQVEEVKIREKMDKVKQKADFVDVKMKSFVIELKKEKKTKK